MLSERSKQIRATGLGSSDVAALVGLDEHRGPIDVFLSKVGLGSEPQNDAMESGHELEAAIGRMYCRRTGAKLHSGGGTLRHPKFPWAVCTLDRRATGPAPIVEIKNIGAFMTRPWRHGVPDSKFIQVTWQMFVTGLRPAHIMALLGGTMPRIFHVEYDAELAEMLCDVAHDFWHDRVLPARAAREAGEETWTRFAPEHTPAEAVELADAQFRESNGTLLPATDEARAIWRELEVAEADQKAAKARRDAAEAAAKRLLGPAEEIAGCFTWKHDEVGKTAWAQVAKALNPPQALIDKHTGAPARRFLRKGRQES